MQSNVQSTATMETQLYSLKKFLKAGFDIFPQMYNPNPNSLENDLSNLEDEVENIAMRIHVGPLKVYGPTKARLTAEAIRLGIPPEDLIKQKQNEWNNNYEGAIEVMDSFLKKRHGVGYKGVTRSDVPLKILK